MVNQSEDEVDLSLDLRGDTALHYGVFTLWRTDRAHKAEPLGRVHLQAGSGQVILPPRSLTTLFPPGVATAADADSP
jgi:hypothetical protein